VEHLTAVTAEREQRRIAAGLALRGLADAERIALVAQSSGDLLLTILAALRSRIVPVVVNPLLTAGERQVVLDDAEPTVVLSDGDLRELRATQAERELAPMPVGRPMHYTSGTTGRPKGVWSGILDEVSAAALVAEERDLWDFGPGDHHLVCSPLHHSAPTRFAAGTLLAGGSVTVLDHFAVAAFGDAIGHGAGPLTTFMVPAHFQRLFAAGEVDLAPFRLVAHAGAPCLEELKRTAIARFPTGSVWEFYGSTEGQFTACPATEWEERPGTVGRARPGRSLSVDADGTIWCQVPDHARFRYWRDPAAKAEAWRVMRSPSGTTVASTRPAISTSTVAERISSSRAGSTCTRPRSSPS
jgi:long-chain acyl-CoA synthetase